MNNKDACDVTRGDQLLTGGSDPEPPAPDPLQERLREAYVAGYLDRELDVRKDDRVTRKIAERKARQWVAQRGDSNE